MSKHIHAGELCLACFYLGADWGWQQSQMGLSASDPESQLNMWDAPPARTVDTVDTGGVIRQREKGWPDFHPETYCHRCGQRNVRSWYVAAELWNEATEDDQRGVLAILCPQCFTQAWGARTGITMTWELRPDVGVLLARLRTG